MVEQPGLRANKKIQQTRYVFSDTLTPCPQRSNGCRRAIWRKSGSVDAWKRRSVQKESGRHLSTFRVPNASTLLRLYASTRRPAAQATEYRPRKQTKHAKREYCLARRRRGAEGLRNLGTDNRQLTAEETENLRSQFATSSVDWGGRRYKPFAFTEHGAIMAASVLNSPRAIQTSIFVVRAFVRLRHVLASQEGLAAKVKRLHAASRRGGPRVTSHGPCFSGVPPEKSPCLLPTGSR
jgi:hypothetical protein